MYRGIIYTSLTADPRSYHSKTLEVMPVNVLKPYIRCFWTNTHVIEDVENKVESHEEVVIIPDTCMDIIFVVDYKNNRIESTFCGINDSPSKTLNNWKDQHISVFAIRFYAWSVTLFSDDSVNGVLNINFEAKRYFSSLVKVMEEQLFEVRVFSRRMEIATQHLLSMMNLKRSNDIFCNAMGQIFVSKGSLKLSELTKSSFVCERQLQRIFRDNLGVTPKKIAALIRYQYLWRDFIQNPNLNIQEAVNLYGYTDQSHLNNDFKKYHSMSPKQAISYAHNHVGFLQDLNR